jgi:hypothetical protein
MSTNRLEATVVNGAAGMLYTGRDVPFSRQNEVGYSERRNLWERSEDPANAYWTKIATTLTQSTDAPPGFVGSTNFTNTGEFGGQLQRVSTWAVGQQHVVSCYAKASGNGILQFRPLDDEAVITQFNLSTGAVGTLGSTRWSGHLMQNLGNGWYRVSAIYTPAATTVTHRYINPTGNSGSNGILMTGFMVNDGAVLQPYQRIGTNPGTSVLFPATLSPGKSAAGDDLQFAGPVPMNGQAEESNCFSFDGADDIIGVDLDGVAGDELVTNGTFDTDISGWSSTNVTLSHATDSLRVVNSSGTFNNFQGLFSSNVIPGRNYVLSLKVKVIRSWPSNGLRFYGGPGDADLRSISNTTDTQTLVFTARTTSPNLLLMRAADGLDIDIDNISVKLLPVITSQGTSTVTYRSQGDGITGTAGTAYEIKLGTAEEIPCSEGAGVEVHGVIRNVAYPIINGQASNWGTKQNTFHYNLVNGHNQLLDPDTAAYIAAVEFADGQTLEPAVQAAINQFIRGCKSDGIWNAIKASCILAGARTLDGALIPLKGSAPTNNGPFVSGDYNRKTGLLGNGSTKHLDSNRANNVDPQNNFSNGVYITVATTLSGTVVLSANASAPGGTSLGAFLGNSRSRTAIAFNPEASSFAGFFGTSRSASTGYSYRRLQATQTITQASQTPSTDSIFIFANNGNTLAATDARLAFYWIGESLDLALLDARVTTLINDIGAAIP